MTPFMRGVVAGWLSVVAAWALWLLLSGALDTAFGHEGLL